MGRKDKPKGELAWVCRGWKELLVEHDGDEPTFLIRGEGHLVGGILGL